MDDLGLCWDHERHCYVYGWHHGWGRSLQRYRFPRWLLGRYVHAVNWVACRVWAHKWMPEWDKMPEPPGLRYVLSSAKVAAFWDAHREEVCTSCGASRVRP